MIGKYKRLEQYKLQCNINGIHRRIDDLEELIDYLRGHIEELKLNCEHHSLFSVNRDTMSESTCATCSHSTRHAKIKECKKCGGVPTTISHKYNTDHDYSLGYYIRCPSYGWCNGTTSRVSSDVPSAVDLWNSEN